MAAPSRATTALLTEHFRYTPLSLIDEIINAVNTIVYRGIEAVESGLLNIPPATLGFPVNQPGDEGDDGENRAAADEIEHGVHQLETLLEATVDKAFDKFEIYTLRNIFTVPEDVAPYVRLSHYESIELPPSKSTSKSTLSSDAPQPTPESLHILRRQLLETRKLNKALRATQAQNAALLSDLKSLLSPPTQSNPQSQSQPQQTPHQINSLAFLTTPYPSPPSSNPPPSASPGQLNLKEKSQFITSQLPALKSLLSTLRPRLLNLQSQQRTRRLNDGEGEDMEWEANGNENVRDNKEEERRWYIESAVARVVGGSGNGSGRWEGEGGGGGGERRGVEEVEALEGLGL